MKLVKKRPVIKSRFKQFNFPSLGLGALKSTIKKNSALKNALKSIFSKKGFVVAAAAGVVATGAALVDDYITTNSGCFMKSENSVCKVKESSCCQPNAVEGVQFCPSAVQGNPCFEYQDDGGDCCKLCDCQYHGGCPPNHEMVCQRPTVGEALSYFAQNVSSSVWSGLLSLLPWLYWVFGILAGIAILWLVSFVWNKVR